LKRTRKTNYPRVARQWKNYRLIEWEKGGFVLERRISDRLGNEAWEDVSGHVNDQNDFFSELAGGELKGAA
jgi:hypothetical protein